MVVDSELLEDIYDGAGVAKKEMVKEFFENKKVKITKVIYDNEKNFEVCGSIKSDEENVYETYIKVEDNELENVKCTCADYQKNYSSCEHIIATMMEFANNNEYMQIFDNTTKKAEIQKLYKNNSNKYRIYNQIINSFYGKLEEKEEKVETVKEPIRLIPELIYNNQTQKMKIEFKIGSTQMYKIKNLSEFYERMIKHEKYKYGAKLEFEHRKEIFATQDIPLLNFLLKYAEIIKFTNESTNNYEYYGRTLNDNCIIISYTCMDELFEILNNSYVNLESNYNNDKVLFINAKPEIKFFIEEINEHEYKLYTNIDIYSYEILYGKNYIYILMNDRIYRCDKSIENTILKLLNIMRSNFSPEVIFKKEESTKFFSLVMPIMKNDICIDEISLDDMEKYIPEELYVKLYLDFDKNNYITADIKFGYKNVEFNPLINQQNLKIARDVAKESKTIDMFIKSGFMFDQANSRLILTKEDQIYEFLSNDIEKYMQKFEVLVTENFKQKEIRAPQISSLGVRIENDLLKVNLSGLNFDKQELKEILNKYKLKKKYYRLKDGSFLNLEKNDTLELVQGISLESENSYKELEKGEISLPIYRSLYLDKLLDNLKTNVIKNTSYKEIVKNIKEKELDESIEIPQGLNANLRIYQQAGYKWLKNLDTYRLGGILADDMGLGKTIQLIAMLLDYVQSNEKSKASLVVCPSSLALNWYNELLKFAPQLKVLIIAGNQNDRKEKIKMISKYDVVITSYDLLKRDIDIYEEIKYSFKYIIADEAQYIKNNNTQNFKTIKKISAETRYALTGTPIENSLSELWSIFDFIMPGYLFSYKKFKELYEIPIVKDEDTKALEKLKMLIEPFILRRIKEEVLTELPDKTITVLNNEMEAEQEKLYLSYMMQAKHEITQEINLNGFEKSQMKILALLMRLRQICCHPSLFIDNYKGGSSKLSQCTEIIKDAVQSGHKILLFSGYTSMFNFIEKELEKEGIKYFKLTGKTKVSDRIELVDEFNENSDIKVFLISLKAGGTGLNLIGADMVIHYDPWWNLSTENQATDRTYRIGQKRNVQVYKLITKNSIEEKIYELQRKKAKLIDNMLSTRETFISKLSKEEIMELFK